MLLRVMMINQKVQQFNMNFRVSNTTKRKNDKFLSHTEIIDTLYTEETKEMASIV